MGWLGVVGVYVLCRQVGARPIAAFLGASVVALNPLHVNLSHSFMMDVPFSAMVTWSLVFLCRGLLNRSWAWIAIGVIIAQAAVLSRQPGLAVPVAVAIALVLIGFRSAKHLLAATAIVAVTAITHFVVPSLVLGPKDVGGMFGFASLTSSVKSSAFTWHLFTNGLAQSSYLGVFLLPVTLALGLPRRLSLVIYGVSLALTGFAMLAIYVYKLRLPLGINLIYDFGLGPRTLHGADVLPKAGDAFWWFPTAVGFFTTFVVLGALSITTWERRLWLRDRADFLLLLLVPAVYLPPFLVRFVCFDRYLLPLLPPLIALIAANSRPSRPPIWRVLGVAVVLLMGAFSVAGTRDYLEHHRCRWELLKELTAEGVEPSDIHGGFEFSLLHAESKHGASRWGRISNERFVVSLAGQIEGYRVVRERSYQRLLPPGKQVIRVLKAVE
jgi:hypothetical protein